VKYFFQDRPNIRQAEGYKLAIVFVALALSTAVGCSKSPSSESPKAMVLGTFVAEDPDTDAVLTLTLSQENGGTRFTDILHRMSVEAGERSDSEFYLESLGSYIASSTLGLTVPVIDIDSIGKPVGGSYYGGVEKVMKVSVLSNDRIQYTVLIYEADPTTGQHQKRPFKTVSGYLRRASKAEKEAIRTIIANSSKRVR
jgi:hypothetical protein